MHGTVPDLNAFSASVKCCLGAKLAGSVLCKVLMFRDSAGSLPVILSFPYLQTCCMYDLMNVVLKLLL